MHENRETSRAPRPAREGGRSAKVPSHKADAHALEESDCVIVSMNQTNKEERSSAESGEKRAWATENIVSFTLARHSAGNSSVPGMERCPRSTLLVIHLRREPYAGKPLVRFCAGAISDGRPYRNTWATSSDQRPGVVATSVASKARVEPRRRHRGEAARARIKRHIISCAQLRSRTYERTRTNQGVYYQPTGAKTQ
jgi:hypothetical protein